MPEVAKSIAATLQGLGNPYDPGQVWLKMKSQESHRSGGYKSLGVPVEGWCRFLRTSVEKHRPALVFCWV
jgi:hypothetical protein